MRIRSVTLGTDVDYPLSTAHFASFEAFQREARVRFAEEGLEVQTVRLATQPFPSVLEDHGAGAGVAFARALESACKAHEIDYCSIGPVMAARPADSERDRAFIAAVPEIIEETEGTFVTILAAHRRWGINLEATWAAAESVVEIGRATPGGFGNLRLAVLANCEPGSPFFPVSYHGGGPTRFSVATEAADLAVKAISGAENLRDAANKLRCVIEQAARTIEEVCEGLARASGFVFGGIDFSLAPFPERKRSVGEAIEQLGVERFGSSGTLFAVAFLKQAIESASFRRCGFSGVMLPVLEDTVLAQRSMGGAFSLDSLLLYSTVCGTGLDTIPLPGDVSVEEVAAVLLDMETLALVADKPLTARLMPIPGKKAGDVTAFDFEYFADGKVMGTPGRGARELFRRDGFWAP